jgi:RHS repeat-associated protein
MGTELLRETGLDYFGARYFSGAQGRFTSPDWSTIPQPIPYADLGETRGETRGNPETRGTGKPGTVSASPNSLRRFAR